MATSVAPHHRLQRVFQFQPGELQLLLKHQPRRLRPPALAALAVHARCGRHLHHLAQAPQLHLPLLRRRQLRLEPPGFLLGHCQPLAGLGRWRPGGQLLSQSRDLALRRPLGRPLVLRPLALRGQRGLQLLPLGLRKDPDLL